MILPRKLFKIFLFLLFFLFTTELSLIFIGKLTYTTKVDEHPNQKNKLNVLILGESTSAGSLHSHWVDWPSELQKFSPDLLITNLSRPAITTKWLVDQALERADSERPDLVITMMGINDGIPHEFQAGHLSADSTWWQKLRLYRLIKGIITESRRLPTLIYKESPWKIQGQALEDFGLRHFKSDLVLEKEIADSMDAFIKNRKSPAYEVFKSTFPSWQTNDTLARIERIIENRYAATFDPYIDGLRFDILKDLFFDRNVFYKGKTELFLGLAPTFEGEKSCLQLWRTLAKNRIWMSQIALTRMKSCLVKTSPQKYNEFLKVYGVSQEEFALLGQTQLNYQRLYMGLKERRICLLALTYPQQGPKTLRSYFRGVEDTTYLVFGNMEDVFSKEVNELGSKSVFTDLFARDFGHMSEYGHKLFAKKVRIYLQKVKEECLL